MSEADEDDDTLPSVLAVPCLYTFVPEEATDDYLVGFVEGRYDSLNEGLPGADVEREREQARAELQRRRAKAPV